MPSEPAPKNGSLCSDPKCNKPSRARGFCIACYYRMKRKGEIVAGSQTRKWKHRLSEIDPATKMGVCTSCGPTPLIARGTIGWRCGSDPNNVLRSRAYKEAYRASKRSMLGQSCEACGTSDNLCWDHDHASGKFRGTLCDACNKGIGFFRDNPEFLRAAALYLERDTGIP